MVDNVGVHLFCLFQLFRGKGREIASEMLGRGQCHICTDVCHLDMDASVQFAMLLVDEHSFQLLMVQIWTSCLVCLSVVAKVWWPLSGDRLVAALHIERDFGMGSCPHITEAVPYLCK